MNRKWIKKLGGWTAKAERLLIVEMKDVVRYTLTGIVEPNDHDTVIPKINLVCAKQSL